MTCLDKYLCGIVCLETGEKVRSIPDGNLYDVFLMLINPWGGSHRITACVAFLGVWV